MSAKCQRCGERERRYPLVVTLVAHEMSGPWNAWGACLCEPCRAIVLTAIESAMQPASEKNTAEPGSIRKDEQASRSSEGFDDGEAAAVHLSTDSAVPASPACEHEWNYTHMLTSYPVRWRCKKCPTTASDAEIREMKEAASPPALREWTEER